MLIFISTVLRANMTIISRATLPLSLWLLLQLYSAQSIHDYNLPCHPPPLSPLLLLQLYSTQSKHDYNLRHPPPLSFAAAAALQYSNNAASIF